MRFVSAWVPGASVCRQKCFDAPWRFGRSARLPGANVSPPRFDYFPCGAGRAFADFARLAAPLLLATPCDWASSSPRDGHYPARV